MSQPKKKRDPLRKLKYIANQMASFEGRKNPIIEDFVKYAKFELAFKTKTLLKDPIWDTYTAEEILVEFFAYQFKEDKKFAQEFNSDMGTGDTDVDAWADQVDKLIAEEDKIREEKLKAMDESVSFDPASLMGDRK